MTISDSASAGWRSAGWDAVGLILAADGSATHPGVAALLAARATQRDLADAVHAICAVHGGTSDRLHEAMALPAAADHRPWLERVADGFVGERRYLAALISAAGPLPSTPGQAQTEQAFGTARHALRTLAVSGRRGCMLGATVALFLDWRTVRALLDRAAIRFGIAVPAETLPDPRTAALEVERLGPSPAAERAMAFGAQQALSQQRALWDLIEARSSARHSG